MSLYKFFESYVDENPELITINAAPSLKYDGLYSFFKHKSKRLPIDSFFDMLFYQSFMTNSKNLREYEILQLKSRRLGSLVQKQFNMVLNKEREEKQTKGMGTTPSSTEKKH